MNRNLYLGLIITGVVLFVGFFLLQNIQSQSKKVQPSPTPLAQKTKVKLGYSVGPVRALPILIAKKQGIFEKYNLDVEAQATVKGVAAALISGQFDVFNEGISTFLSGAVKGAELKLVGVTINVDPYYMVGFSTTDKTKVKKVAVNRLGGDDYYQTINTLRLMGIDPAKVEFILSGDFAGKYPMLLKKIVDLAGYPPIAEYAKVNKLFANDNISIIFNRTDDPNAYYPTGINARSEFVKNNPEAVKQLILALKESMEYARSHSDESIKAIMEEYQLNEEDAKQLYGLYLDSTKTIDMKPRMAFITTLLEDMKIELEEAPSYDATKFVDTTFTP